MSPPISMDWFASRVSTNIGILLDLKKVPCLALSRLFRPGLASPRRVMPGVNQKPCHALRY
jgi:hypothetical protein